jgi:hypothetical protein
MRISMNVIKNEHGVFHVRKKVPKKLEEATATVMGSSKHRVAWLKKSLGTKDLKAAKVRATSVLMEFDRILSEAEALLVERPLRTSLQPREIERIADYFFASQLAGDEEDRREGGSEQGFQDIARQLSEAGVDYQSPYPVGVAPPKFGLPTARCSDEQRHWSGPCLPLRRRSQEGTSLASSGKLTNC